MCCSCWKGIPHPLGMLHHDFTNPYNLPVWRFHCAYPALILPSWASISPYRSCVATFPAGCTSMDSVFLIPMTDCAISPVAARLVWGSQNSLELRNGKIYKKSLASLQKQNKSIHFSLLHNWKTDIPVYLAWFVYKLSCTSLNRHE